MQFAVISKEEIWFFRAPDREIADDFALAIMQYGNLANNDEISVFVPNRGYFKAKGLYLTNDLIEKVKEQKCPAIEIGLI